MNVVIKCGLKDTCVGFSELLCYGYTFPFSWADLKLCLKRPVHWHVIGLGTAPEVHSIFFEGHTFLVRNHRHTILEISPATFLTAQTMPVSSGRFLMFCQIPSHQQGNICSAPGLFKGRRKRRNGLGGKMCSVTQGPTHTYSDGVCPH